MTVSIHYVIPAPEWGGEGLRRANQAIVEAARKQQTAPQEGQVNTPTVKD